MRLWTEKVHKFSKPVNATYFPEVEQEIGESTYALPALTDKHTDVPIKTEVQPKRPMQVNPAQMEEKPKQNLRKLDTYPK